MFESLNFVKSLQDICVSLCKENTSLSRYLKMGETVVVSNMGARLVCTVEMNKYDLSEKLLPVINDEIDRLRLTAISRVTLFLSRELFFDARELVLYGGIPVTWGGGGIVFHPISAPWGKQFFKGTHWNGSVVAKLEHRFHRLEDISRVAMRGRYGGVLMIKDEGDYFSLKNPCELLGKCDNSLNCSSKEYSRLLPEVLMELVEWSEAQGISINRVIWFSRGSFSRVEVCTCDVTGEYEIRVY